MPSAKAAMFTALSKDSGIYAVVGTKVYPDAAPETDGVVLVEEPYLIFQMVSDVPRVGFRGPINLGDYRFQLTGYCATRLQTQQLNAAILSLLHGDKGGPGKFQTMFGGLMVKASICSQEEGSVDEDEAPRPGEEFGLRVVRLDVRWFT